MRSRRVMTMAKRTWRSWMVAAALLLASGGAFAQSGGGSTGGSGSDGMCNDSGLITGGGFISDLCWNCFFPIKIGPVDAGGGPVPSGRAAPMCVCPGRFGIPAPGITLGMWQPTHIMESTRAPMCSPSFGGTMLGGSSSLESLDLGGSGGDSTGDSYRHFHLFMFPVGAIMDMFNNSVCSASGFDLDILFMSEIDPTHDDESLSMLTTPEAFLFASAAAQAACVIDASASSASKPIQAMPWCVGAWGSLYPMTGNRTSSTSAPKDAALGMVRGLGMMHRRMLLKKTYGSGALCSNQTALQLPKQQYRFQIQHPIANTRSNEWMGRSTLLGRESHHLPSVGEDFVNINWTYEECCATFY